MYFVSIRNGRRAVTSDYPATMIEGVFDDHEAAFDYLQRADARDRRRGMWATQALFWPAFAACLYLVATLPEGEPRTNHEIAQEQPRESTYVRPELPLPSITGYHCATRPAPGSDVPWPCLD